MVSKHKYKRSRQRERIYSLLCSTDTHPTASWIYDELRKDFNNLSMGTVYRNINILIDQKKVRRLEAGSSFDRFDGNVKAHYHLICDTCGKIEDLPDQVFNELNAIVNASTDFRAEKHRLDFYGICSACKDYRNI